MDEFDDIDLGLDGYDSEADIDLLADLETPEGSVALDDTGLPDLDELEAQAGLEPPVGVQAELGPQAIVIVEHWWTDPLEDPGPAAGVFGVGGAVAGGIRAFSAVRGAREAIDATNAVRKKVAKKLQEQRAERPGAGRGAREAIDATNAVRRMVAEKLKEHRGERPHPDRPLGLT